jgi:sodium-coupled neutral amino acid transporter 11
MASLQDGELLDSLGNGLEEVAEDVASGGSGQSSIAEASFNLVNSIVGAGLIGIPFALREAGVGVGVMLLLAMGLITDYSIRLLVRTGVENQRLVYQDMVKLLLGKQGEYCLLVAQFLFPTVGMVACKSQLGFVSM